LNAIPDVNFELLLEALQIVVQLFEGPNHNLHIVAKHIEL
jgi:hypothetical protein